MNAQTLLLQAADHIEKYGKEEGNWVPPEFISYSGSLVDTRCPSCAMGALAIEASDGRSTSPNSLSEDQRHVLDEAVVLLTERLHLPSERWDRPMDRVIEWSDSNDQATVVAGLRTAAG